MKYVIEFSILFSRKTDSTESYPCVNAYVKGFQWTDRRSKPSIDWTPHLHEAITYADPCAANCIKSIIERRFEDARVTKVTDKDLFKAKLTHK